MTWLKGLLIALGLVVVLVFAIIAALGLLTSDKGKEVRHISIGQRTITVSHYKDLTQETTADGVKIVVDGHTITATPDAIAIDGKAQTFDPTQDVEITVDETGAVQARSLSADAPRPDEETSDEGAGNAAPPQ
jgi:cytoskeletal protein RodZ